MSGRGVLAGKVAVITGGASGQGRASALRFAAEGARVLVADVDDDGAADTVTMVAKAGGEAAATHANVALESDNVAMIDDAVERWGRLDVLYNNAAI